jgi:hypothetical protein
LLCMIFMLASFYVGLLVGQQSMDSKCQECLRDYSSIQREYYIYNIYWSVIGPRRA